MIIDNKITIDFSNYFDFNIFSNGYYWMPYETVLSVLSILNKNGFCGALNSPTLWNNIGKELFNVEYKEIDGDMKFIFPQYSDVLESDLHIQNTAGDMVKTFTSNKYGEIFFSNKTKIILYNNEIVVDIDDISGEPNISNIIYNVITLFILQKIKREAIYG